MKNKLLAYLCAGLLEACGLYGVFSGGFLTKLGTSASSTVSYASFNIAGYMIILVGLVCILSGLLAFILPDKRWVRRLLYAICGVVLLNLGFCLVSNVPVLNLELFTLLALPLFSPLLCAVGCLFGVGFVRPRENKDA